MKKVIIVSIILFILVAAGFTYLYMDNNKEKENVTFESIMKEAGQNVTVDDIQITLVKYYYEEEHNDGKCIIEIEYLGNDSKKLVYTKSAEYSSLGFCFGLNEYKYRLANLDISNSRWEGNCDCEILNKSDHKLTIEYKFLVEVDISNILGIIDYNEKWFEGYSKIYGQFELNDNIDWTTFCNGDDKIEASAIAVKINEGKEKDISTLSVYMKDGKRYSTKEDSFYVRKSDYKNCVTEAVYCKTKNGRRDVDDVVDVENIDYIEWNGKKFERK